MSYYDNSQWPAAAAAAGQAGWEHQTPPARSGANSAIPREEQAAFVHQLEEVDRAVDNLVKSGKMFGMPGGGRHARMGHGGPRQHPIADYGDSRGHTPSTNLQNFYAAQRHQSSRGSNEAEQMMQAKRRMAAQRERELRNYHQEQQYNRTVLAEFPPYGNTKPDRTISPGSMSEDERRELIARQRNALYGEGGFSDDGGPPRPGIPGPPAGPAGLRGHSPLAYEYGRTPPAALDTSGPVPPSVEGGPTPQSGGPSQRSRAGSTASPQSNPPGSKGVFDGPGAQQSSRTSTSSPGGSPPRAGPPNSKPGQAGAVAPIGTRPSATSATPANPALNKRSTTPLPSPLSQGYSAPGTAGEHGAAVTTSVPSNPASATTESPPVGLSGWGGRSGVWGGNKSGLGVQASVWG